MVIYSNEINDFIIKVFNYYNGKINVINKATLYIDWQQSTESITMGSCTIPNIIIIYPAHVMNKYDSDLLKIIIVETVIHELNHADQLVDYKLCEHDDGYINYVEKACESQTASYIISHKQEIYDIFNINMRSALIEYYEHQISSLLIYMRKSYYDHIFECIMDLYNFNNNISREIYHSLTNDNKYINICINDKLIHIRNNGVLIPLEIFNNYIYKYVCADDKYSILKSYINNDRCLYLDIQIQIKNTMCLLKED